MAGLVHVGGYLCARLGLTVLDLADLFSLGGEELRRSVVQDFEHHIISRRLADLSAIAARNPREFYSLCESTHNRLIRFIGNPPVRRILGQKTSLDLRSIMDEGDVVLADLSPLSYADAAFVAGLYTSMCFEVARHRPPNQSHRHRLVLDEAESLITLNVARMCDQSAKQGLLLCAAIQRLGQLRARGDFIADALLTNCGIKICFGGLEFESARYVAENFFAGHVDLQEFKPASVRPVAVGNELVTLRNRSIAHHQARHRALATTDVVSHGRAVGLAQANMSAWASGSSDGTTSGVALAPADLLGGAATLSQHAAQQQQRNVSIGGGRSAVRSSARQSARARGSAIMRGQSDGVSASQGESEAYVTRYEDMPTQFYSLEEQMHKATAALTNLPRRECFVKVENEPPYKMRTPDLGPAFKTAAYASEMLPRFLANAVRRSPYLAPIAEVDAEIAERSRRILKPEPQPEPDFSEAEEVPILDGLARARELLNREPPKPTEPPGRRTNKSKLRIVDGGKEPGDSVS
jgi:hypothetical protein